MLTAGSILCANTTVKTENTSTLEVLGSGEENKLLPKNN